MWVNVKPSRVISLNPNPEFTTTLQTQCFQWKHGRDTDSDILQFHNFFQRQVWSSKMYLQNFTLTTLSVIAKISNNVSKQLQIT